MYVLSVSWVYQNQLQRHNFIKKSVANQNINLSLLKNELVDQQLMYKPGGRGGKESGSLLVLTIWCEYHLLLEND